MNSKKEWETIERMMVGDFDPGRKEEASEEPAEVTDEMSKFMDMAYGAFDEDGVWKTINGAHVFIEGGEITKGPAALTGKKSEGKKSDVTTGKVLEVQTANQKSTATQKSISAQVEKATKNGSTSPYTESDFGASKYKVGTKFGNISYGEAEKFFSDAPEGTKIKMDNHNTGDYVGEYTKKNGSWVGSQEYKSGYVTPPTVKTAKGFAMQVSGNDLKVISAGSGSAKEGGERLGLKALTSAKIGTRIRTGTGKVYEKTDDRDTPWHNIDDRHGDKVSSTYLAQYKEPGGAYSITGGESKAKKADNAKSNVDVSKGFPKIVKFDGAEYYKAEEMSGGARSYVRWDDSNNAQYITVNKKGEIERN